jgi:hypothetical protein
MWRTKDGKIMSLSDMTDSHLENALAYSKRRGDRRSLNALKKEYARRNQLKNETVNNLKIEDTALEYEEWKASGYFVKKGCKSRIRDPLGSPLFMADQVVKGSSNKTHWEECSKRSKTKGTPWGVVEDFDSFVREAGMMPDLNRRTVFAINNPLEHHFMNVAEKHGIIDGICDGYGDDYY